MNAHSNHSWYGLFFQNRIVLMDFFFMVMAVWLLGILSQIYIPLWPVPLTMQTFGIFLIAFFFGAIRGGFTLIAYLVVGMLGFSVFAQGKSGLAPFLGPTGGYLIGFVFMALFIGGMVERGFGASFRDILLVMVVGEIVLYVFGLAGLYLYFSMENPAYATLYNVIKDGLIPFIVGDTLKALAAASLFPHVRKLRTIQ